MPRMSIQDFPARCQADLGSRPRLGLGGPRRSRDMRAVFHCAAARALGRSGRRAPDRARRPGSSRGTPEPRARRRLARCPGEPGVELAHECCGALLGIAQHNHRPAGREHAVQLRRHDQPSQAGSRLTRCSIRHRQALCQPLARLVGANIMTLREAALPAQACEPAMPTPPPMNRNTSSGRSRSWP